MGRIIQIKERLLLIKQMLDKGEVDFCYEACEKLKNDFIEIKRRDQMNGDLRILDSQFHELLGKLNHLMVEKIKTTKKIINQ